MAARSPSSNAAIRSAMCWPIHAACSRVGCPASDGGSVATASTPVLSGASASQSARAPISQPHSSSSPAATPISWSGSSAPRVVNRSRARLLRVRLTGSPRSLRNRSGRGRGLNPAHPAVPWARVWPSPARRPGRAGAVAWWDRIAARSPSANRPEVPAWPSARSTTASPCSRASSTASAILARTRPAPVAAASVSHNVARHPAPGTPPRWSSWVAGSVQRPGRGRREVRVGDPRAARGGLLVAGDLDRATGPTCTITICSPWRRTTVSPTSRCGTEYWQCSKLTIGVLSATVRVTPNVAVNGVAGNGAAGPAPQ